MYIFHTLIHIRTLTVVLHEGPEGRRTPPSSDVYEETCRVSESNRSRSQTSHLCLSLLQHPYSYIPTSSRLIRYKKQPSDCRMITTTLPMSTLLTYTSCVGSRFFSISEPSLFPYPLSPLGRPSSPIINKRNFTVFSFILQGRLSTLVRRFDYRNQSSYLSLSSLASITDRDNEGKFTGGGIVDRDNQGRKILIIKVIKNFTTSLPTFPILKR